MKNVFGLLIAGVAIILMCACGTNKIKDPLNYDVQSFSFQNQDNKTVSLDSLKGKVWVADFIFTNCNTICPPMTSHMAELQKQMDEENLQARIVSFSVDPENDTPEKLKKFAANYPLSFENWDFLTGYSQAEIERFALKSFKAIVKKPENEDQVIHQSSFYLVDQEGKVVKDYDGAKDTPYSEIIADIKILENR
ncbi:SCO family protein [Bacillus sonorensis]|uniref:SCO1 protein-like protein n=3 Tax=Bacillaceae TaxID=186817 RepID=M5PA83_9BACI|nr:MULTISPECIES: SCO family protein [Bacillus]TWK82462.1 SCO1 protein [Bacillus paralicheniformis]ASB88802.1 SCO1 protein like protein [Bacillus sonorensis]EME76388.1 SCO1 protein-like protein [Bacillus sonorensis L12]MBG9915400.1 cysteine ABC transporter ATP-binding protein [Bacillus sonorensis]MCY7856876.1 SCO family protein [Bacillus sonorensis]